MWVSLNFMLTLILLLPVAVLEREAVDKYLSISTDYRRVVIVEVSELLPQLWSVPSSTQPLDTNMAAA